MSEHMEGAAFFRPREVECPVSQRQARPDPADPGFVLARIKDLHDATAEVVPPRPQEGSELAADDAALEPYALSHAVSFATGIAMDHLEAVRSLIQDAGHTHPWAQHTLLRAAFESACTALWLIGPADPLERRYRRLKQAMNDADESRKARNLHDVEPESGRTPAEIKARIVSLAPDERSLGGWTYRDVVRGAAECMRQSADFFELVWRAQSGLAHGKSWATMAMLEHDEEPSDIDGIVNVRFTTSVEQLIPAAALTVNIVQAAWKLREARGSRPWHEALGSADRSGRRGDDYSW